MDGPLKAALGGGVSLTIAFVVYNWQVEKPRITWTVTNSAIHKAGNKTLQISNIQLLNRGVKEAENLECTVRVPGSKIDDMEVTPDTIRFSKTVNDDVATISIPLLGEDESLGISLMSSNTQENKWISYASNPYVLIRGKGVRVEEKPLEIPGHYYESLLDWALYGQFTHAIMFIYSVLGVAVAFRWYSAEKERARAQESTRLALADVQKLLREIKTGVKKSV